MMYNKILIFLVPMEVSKIDTGIAFQIGSLTVRWYGIMIVTGIVAAIFIAAMLAKRKAIDIDHLLNIALLAVPFGILGARAYYVIFEWPYYSQHPNEILATWKGGLAIHGAIIAGGLAIFCYVLRKKHSFRVWGDILTPGLILAQAVGRWGNYFNQEAYGYETTVPWAMFIDGAYRHPTFLYESIWDAVGFVLLLVLWQAWKKRKNGDIMACYMIYYSLGRFVVESFRTDSLMLGPFRVAMLISLVGVVLGALLLYFNRRRPVEIMAGGQITGTVQPAKPAKQKKGKK